MKHGFLLILGPVLAGLFAAFMYAIHGNLNWGGEAERALPWFEPTFWTLFASGAVLLLAYELCSVLSSKHCHQ